MSDGKSKGPDVEPDLTDEMLEEMFDQLDAERLSDDAPEEEEEALPGGLDQIIAERDDMRDRWMRALAEAENLRKRGERDRRDAEIYGGTRLARDLLSVYDNMNRALDAITDQLREDAGPLVEGIELTQKDLLATFAKHKIELLNPEMGEKFDPKMHQAMFEAPVPGTTAGTVIQVMNVGFTIGDRLLRPAQVGVSSNVGGESDKS